MKKILLTLALLLSFNAVYAEDNLSFIYINGSNNNDQKMKNWYENGVKKLHPVLRKKFLNSKTINKSLENSGGLHIKEEPVIFFWGYNSKDQLQFVKNQLEISKMVSSTGAYIVRNLITQFMHDAVWVQKSHNMQPILDELNETVKKETADNNSVVLYGYSAGTFVTYEYLFNKLRYINLEHLFKELKTDEEFLNFVKENPQNNTCLSALSIDNAGIGMLSSAGHLKLNPNTEQLKKNYLKLNSITEEVCAPKDKVFGVVNFASPIPLFYSDMSDEKYELSYYNKFMLKYILENGMFLLTVNFKEDPLGFPSSRNFTIQELENRVNLKVENPTGIFYDDSGVWSKHLFPFAHTSYWTARSTFSNAVVDSLINGYKFQYDKEYQEKVLKRNRKKSEL